MAHDVFISYSSQDKPSADAICATLESKQVRCWIAPRDVLPGVDYAEALIEAIKVTEREMTENSVPKEKKAILEEKADILTGRANIEKAIKQTVETIVSHKVGPTGLNRAKKTLRQTVAAFKEAVKE